MVLHKVALVHNYCRAIQNNSNKIEGQLFDKEQEHKEIRDSVDEMKVLVAKIIVELFKLAFTPAHSD